MADGSRRRLFGRRSTAATESLQAVPAPTTAPKDEGNGDPVVVEPVSLEDARTRTGPRGERVVVVAVRLTPAERARWAAAATAAGRSQLGRWVRETVMAQLERRPARAQVSPEVAEQLSGLRAELSHVGSNLNQIARALNVANRGGEPAPGSAAVLAAVAATREELGSVRDRLPVVRA